MYLRRSLSSAFRSVSTTPVPTIIAVLSLGLGIGAGTTVFSLMNALILRSVPVRDPQHLVAISTIGGDIRDQTGRDGLSLPMLDEIEKSQLVFSGVCAWGEGISTLEANGSIYGGSLTAVTGSYFSVLGIRPELGRLITREDVGTPVAVLNYTCWRSRYGGDRTVIGKTIRANGHPLTIIGVTPESFAGLFIDVASDIMVPVGFSGNKAYRSPANMWDIAARLKPGVSVEQARLQLSTIWPGVIGATVPDDLQGIQRSRFLQRRIDVQSATNGVSYLRLRFSKPLNILFSLAAMMLIMACVNLAGLMAARTLAHKHEFGIRIALGASRLHLLAQILGESMFFSAAGAVSGLLMAIWMPRLLLNYAWQGYGSLAVDASPDLRVLLFTILVMVCTASISAITPAWRATRINPAESMQLNSRTVVDRHNRLGQWLVAVQVALSVALVFTAMMSVRSISNLYTVSPGYHRDRLLTVQLFPQPGRAGIEDRPTYYRQLADRIGQVPGVDSVTYSNFGPVCSAEYRQPVSSRGSSSPAVRAAEDAVGPGFFHVMGIRIRAGRDFEWRDDHTSPRVAIVSEGLARLLFPGQDPIGKKIDVETEPDHTNMEIVGVVDNASLWTVRSTEPPAFYVPLMQEPRKNQFLVDIRTIGAPRRVAASVARVIQSFGKQFALETETAEERFDTVTADERMISTLSVFFGAFALLLASMGLYALMSYMVTQRTPEIGIRVALGATRNRIVRLTFRDVIAPLLAGVVVGLPCCSASAWWMSSMLFGVRGGDPVSIIVAAGAVFAVAIVAGYGPTRRAARLDPMTALRTE